MLALAESQDDETRPRRPAWSYVLVGRQRWYFARTPRNRESLAKLHLDEQGYRNVFPRFRTTVRHARQVRDVVVPLFRGYLFVIIDDERDSWRAINGTGGVGHPLTMRGRPIPVPHGIADALVATMETYVETQLAPTL